MSQIYGYPGYSGSSGSGNTVYAGGGLSYSTNPDGTLTFFASGSYITYLYDPSIVGSVKLIEGNNVTLVRSATGLTINAQVTGSGATSSGSYIVGTTEASLPNSSVATEGNGISISVTPGGNATFGVSTAITGANVVTWDSGDTIFTNRRQLIIGSGLSAAYGTNTLTLTATASGGGGTVNSVGLLLPVDTFTITNSPVTSSGTLTGSFASQAPTAFFAGPSGGFGTPLWRRMVGADMPLAAGSNITFTPNASGGITIASTASGGGGGSVTTVSAQSLSPLFTVNVTNPTTTPDIAFTLVNQACSTVYAGPVSGANAAPDFRALVAGDIPTLPFSKISGTVPVSQGGTNLTATPANGQLPIGNGTDYTLATITAGTGVQVTNGSGTITVAATGALGGTVTSIDQSVPAALLTIGGTPITTAGTLAIGLTTAASAQFWAGPTSGAAATPAYRSIVAGDLPSSVVTSVGNLSPIFTSSITAQVLSFALSSVASGAFLAGPATGASTSPTYRAIQGQDLGAIVAGSNITITPVGNTISIASAGGGGGLTASTIATSATASVNTVTFVSLATSNVNITLPSSASQGGKEILIKIIANAVPPNTLTINATAINASGTMDGDATLSSQNVWDGYRFISDGTNNWSQFA